MRALLGLFVGLGINMVTLGTLKLRDIQGYLVSAVLKVVFYSVASCLNGWGFEKLG